MGSCRVSLGGFFGRITIVSEGVPADTDKTRASKTSSLARYLRLKWDQYAKVGVLGSWSIGKAMTYGNSATPTLQYSTIVKAVGFLKY
jgi:hypothetical protein